MGELGRVLALLQGAHTSFTSFVGMADHFYDPGVRYAALERARSTGALIGAAGMPSDPVSEAVWTLWVDQPSRMRAEQTGRRPGRRPGPCTMVVDGQRWWTWDQEYGARYGTGIPQQISPFTITGLEALLDPRALLAVMRGFSLGDTMSVAGREAIGLHARYGGHRNDVFDTEIAVDAERGVALRVVERFDGEIVEVRELTSVQFDVPIDAEVFTFVPPDGEEPLPLPISGSVTVEEAAVVCSFGVYVPAEIPDGAEVELTYWPGWQRDPLPGPTFTVHVRHDQHLVWIEQWTGFRCCLNEPSRPQAVVRNGQTVFVSTDSNGWHSVEMRRGDTGLKVRSTEDLELLVSIATCLVPASATDPPVWSPAALSKGGIVGVPVPHPAPAPNWRHPDLTTRPGLDALLEVVYGTEHQRVPLRATVTSTWYGRPGEPRLDPPVTAQADVSAGMDKPPASTRSTYDDLLDPGGLIPTLDFKFGEPVELEGRRAVCATATPCEWMSFPRHPAAIFGRSSLVDTNVDRMDLVIDVKAGFLLAVTTWAGGQMVCKMSMGSVTVG